MTGEHSDALKAAATHWDQRFDRQASVAQRGSTYALASPLYQELYTNPRFATDGSDWVSWVKRMLDLREPCERALVLGCGLGDGVLDLYRRGIARRLHGVDLSSTAIERAREMAVDEGFAREVTFEVGDFHACPLEEGAFDVVFMIGSLHHALDLDQVLARVSRAMTPQGHFVANEYVGPDRWQYSWPQLLLIKALLTLLPRRLRRRADGSLKGRIGRPTLAWMLATDPSEAAHSSAIPTKVAQHFELLGRVDTGGAIAVPVLDEIVANFSVSDPGSLRWFRAVLAVDRWAWRTGLVGSANAVLVGKRRLAS
jgi:SAM-dependent methyltransferase